MRQVAQETLQVLQNGFYPSSFGNVEIHQELAQAVQETWVLDPDQLGSSLGGESFFAGCKHWPVTGEKTAEAARRLAHDGPVTLLNFASATNAGGGFVNGAKAQEEDLARASGLYRCLLEARSYYKANRACPNKVFTDHMIWSPEVPFFRDEKGDFLDKPFTASVITCPAPHADALQEVPAAEYEAILRRRVGKILALAESQRARTLVLGAWGCGVFRNDPDLVADAFGVWLNSLRFLFSFDRVEFAVWDPSGKNRAAFESRLA